jgi:hypothetical protein
MKKIKKAISRLQQIFKRIIREEIENLDRFYAD